MKLFLASEAKHPESIKKLAEFVGGFEGRRIVYIPTAANGEQGRESWKNGEEIIVEDGNVQVVDEERVICR